MGKDHSDTQAASPGNIPGKGTLAGLETLVSEAWQAVSRMEAGVLHSPNTHVAVPQGELAALHQKQLAVIDKVYASFHHRFLADLSTYTTHLEGLQQSIITDPTLTNARKSNLLADTARSLQPEESSMTESKQVFAQMSAYLEGVKTTVNNYQKSIASQMLDLQHATPQPQKLPVSKQAVLSLLQGEKALIRCLQSHLPLSPEEVPSLEVFQAAGNAALEPHLQLADSLAEEHQLTGSIILAECQKRLSGGKYSLAAVGMAGDAAFQKNQQDTKQQLTVVSNQLQSALSGTTQAQQNLSSYDENFGETVHHLAKATDNFARAAQHAHQVETSGKTTKQATTEKKALHAACQSSLKSLHGLLPGTTQGEPKTNALLYNTKKAGQWLMYVWKLLFRRNPPVALELTHTKKTTDFSPDIARQILHSRANSFEGLGLMSLQDNHQNPATSITDTPPSMGENWQKKLAREASNRNSEKLR